MHNILSIVCIAGCLLIQIPTEKIKEYNNLSYFNDGIAIIMQIPETKPNYLYNINLSDELQEYTYNKCQEYDIEYELVLAVMYNESKFHINAKSKTQDYGLMQINKCNHEWLSKKLHFTNNKKDIMNPKINIECGILMLSRLVHKYDGNYKKALKRYNGCSNYSYSDRVLRYYQTLKEKGCFE